MDENHSLSVYERLNLCMKCVRCSSTILDPQVRQCSVFATSGMQHTTGSEAERSGFGASCFELRPQTARDRKNATIVAFSSRLKGESLLHIMNIVVILGDLEQGQASNYQMTDTTACGHLVGSVSGNVMLKTPSS